MRPNWQRTTLNVEPPHYEIAEDDQEPLQFNAGEPVVDATAEAFDMTSGVPVQDNTIIKSITEQAEGAIIEIGGGSRGHLYELQVHFTNSANRKWTRTLFIEFVA